MANRLGWFLGLLVLLILVIFLMIPWDRPLETNTTPSSPTSPPAQTNPPRQ